MKSRAYIAIEGFLYVLMTAGQPWVSVLDSEIELTQRKILATIAASIVVGAATLKAFLSQALTATEANPMPVKSVNTKQDPALVQEVKK